MPPVLKFSKKSWDPKQTISYTGGMFGKIIMLISFSKFKWPHIRKFFFIFSDHKKLCFYCSLPSVFQTSRQNIPWKKMSQSMPKSTTKPIHLIHLPQSQLLQRYHHPICQPNHHPIHQPLSLQSHLLR